MQCPRDGDTLRSEPALDGLTIDACPSCRGIWLDPGELEAIARAYAAHLSRIPEGPDAMTAALAMAKEAGTPLTRCPRCGEDNVRQEWGMASQVLLDHCPHGHGIWLDKGELEAIEAFYARERADARGSVLVEFLNSIGVVWD